MLKPVEDGIDDLPSLPPPRKLATDLDLIPGRLTMHLYEDAVARRWSEVYQGEPLAVRTATRPRELAIAYAQQFGYEFVIMSAHARALLKVCLPVLRQVAHVRRPHELGRVRTFGDRREVLTPAGDLGRLAVAQRVVEQRALGLDDEVQPVRAV